MGLFVYHKPLLKRLYESKNRTIYMKIQFFNPLPAKGSGYSEYLAA